MGLFAWAGELPPPRPARPPIPSLWRPRGPGPAGRGVRWHSPRTATAPRTVA